MRLPFVKRVIRSLDGRALVIGIDRLDYSKGIAERLSAFERFLQKQVEWRGKVTYLQIAPKSRTRSRNTPISSRKPGRPPGVSMEPLARQIGHRSGTLIAPTVMPRSPDFIAPRASRW